MPTSKNRRLAAILFADIVGYTALMQKDEQSASTLLRHFQQQLEKKVSIHNGQIVNFYGDGALCTFQVPVDAVRCAIALQTNFQNEPKTPVRIGIHSGTVTYEGEKIFGDSVNITSRIESIGVPGGILLSKKVRDEVKNNPDLQMQSLGNFEFKNVEEPMEIFALANEGFVIPRRTEMQGKLKPENPKTAKKKNWLFPTITVLLLLGLWTIWQFSSFYRTASLDMDNSPASTPLSKEVRVQSIAVMVFENQTMRSELDAFGKMVSDWVTRALMETGEANVISAANIQPQIAQARFGEGANQEFAAATGVEVVLQGRYYLQEGQLLIHANLVNTKTGEVIHALAPIKGEQAAMMDILNELTQKILSYWAVKKQKRFSQNPPKYEAYQEWLKGVETMDEVVEIPEKHFLKAYELDTNFYAPLLKLHGKYHGAGALQKMDTLRILLDKYYDSFTQWEKLRFDQIKTMIYGKFLESGELAVKRYQMDKSDRTALGNAGQQFNRANYPQKALAVMNYPTLNSLPTEFSSESSYIDGIKAIAYYRLGNYQEILRIVSNYRGTIIKSRLATYHLKALVRLGSFHIIDAQLDYYEQRGVFYSSGNKVSTQHLLYYVCKELFLVGEEKLLQKYATRLRIMAEPSDDKSSNPYFMANAYWFLKDYEMAIAWMEKGKVEQFSTLGSFRYYSNLGHTYALLGNNTKAQKYIDNLLSVELKRPRDAAYQQYYLAGIYAALNQKEKTMTTLKRAVVKGRGFFRNTFKEDPLFKPLFGYPSFEELVKPKR